MTSASLATFSPILIALVSGVAAGAPKPSPPEVVAREADPCAPAGVITLANHDPRHDKQVLDGNKLRPVALTGLTLTAQERLDVEARMQGAHAPGAVGTDRVVTIERDGKPLTGILVSYASACLRTNEVFGISKDKRVYRIDGSAKRLYWISGDDPDAPHLEARRASDEDGTHWWLTDRKTGKSEQKDRIDYVCRTPSGNRPCVLGPDRVALYLLPADATYNGAISAAINWKAR